MAPRQVRAELTGTPLGIALASVGREAAWVEQLETGRSGASKYRVRTHEDEYLFAKVAISDAGKRQQYLLKREADLMAQLPPTRWVPRLIGFADMDEVTALVSEWVDGTSQSTWDPSAAVATVEALQAMREEVAHTALNLRRLSEDGARFRTFSRANLPQRSASLGPEHLAWLAKHRSELLDLEREGRTKMLGTQLLHCDVAADNILLRSSGEAVLVDWSHAALGHPGFDLAALLVRVHADHAASPEFIRAVAELTEPGSLEPMLVLVTGMFLEVSRGEREKPSDALSSERARYSRAGADLLAELLP